jgi:cell division protein FtsB
VLQRAAWALAEGLAELRYRIGRAVRGDRPLVVALAGVLVLSVVLLSGPAQSYFDSRARVDALQLKAEALEHENERLEQRVEDLQDPLNVELLAREQLGFIRPGEVPYTLVPPEVDRPRLTTPRETPEAESGPWYRRAWENVRERLG